MGQGSQNNPREPSPGHDRARAIATQCGHRAIDFIPSQSQVPYTRPPTWATGLLYFKRITICFACDPPECQTRSLEAAAALRTFHPSLSILSASHRVMFLASLPRWQLYPTMSYQHKMEAPQIRDPYWPQARLRLMSDTNRVSVCGSSSHSEWASTWPETGISL